MFPKGGTWEHHPEDYGSAPETHVPRAITVKQGWGHLAHGLWKAVRSCGLGLVRDATQVGASRWLSRALGCI